MVETVVSEVAPDTGINLDGLSDFDLQQFEISVNPNRHSAEAFVPALPVAVVVAVVEAGAEKALPIILAIHRQLKMTTREWTPLNSAIWKAAGRPSDKERAAILRKLKKLPDLIRIEIKRTSVSHYQVAKGPLWGRRRVVDATAQRGISSKTNVCR
jgi:hypothetical protein